MAKKRITKTRLNEIVAREVAKVTRANKKKARLTEAVRKAVRSVLLREQDKEVAAFEKAGDLDLNSYVALLKKIAGDKEFRAVAGAGKTDAAGEADEAITVDQTSVPAGSLKATQLEIGFKASLGDQMTNQFQAVERALGLAGPATPDIIMGSKEGDIPLLVWAPPGGKPSHLLDGHHRWSQVMMTNPEGKVVVDVVSGPAMKTSQDALKMMQLAIAATAGNVATKAFEGTDLMATNAATLKKYVMENVTDEVLQILVKAKKIAEPSKEAAAELFAANLGTIQAAKGKNDRQGGMPQAGKSGVAQSKVNDFLKTGSTNYLNPSAGDVKKGG